LNKPRLRLILSKNKRQQRKKTYPSPSLEFRMGRAFR
jgi:hypothetical protein